MKEGFPCLRSTGGQCSKHEPDTMNQTSRRLPTSALRVPVGPDRRAGRYSPAPRPSASGGATFRPCVVSSFRRAVGEGGFSPAFRPFDEMASGPVQHFRFLKSHGATCGNGRSQHHINYNMKSQTQPESENSGTIKPKSVGSLIAGQVVDRIGEDGPSTAACHVEPDPQSLVPQMVFVTEVPSESAKS